MIGQRSYRDGDESPRRAGDASRTESAFVQLARDLLIISKTFLFNLNSALIYVPHLLFPRPCIINNAFGWRVFKETG